MSNEQWRPIPGMAGYYEVSSQGRVRSVPRTVTSARTKVDWPMSGRVLSQQITPAGYASVHLSINGKAVRKSVHRLVLRAFVGEPKDGMHGCHNDGDSLNNRIENLRWDTVLENRRDILRHGRDGHTNKTHCAHGHEYTPENTYRWRNQRHCRTCGRENAARYATKRKDRA